MNVTKKTTQINDFTVAYYSENDLAMVRKEVFVNKEYYFETDKANPVIIDCGANIGLTTLYFKELYPAATIYAFEANPFTFKLLEENVRNNNLSNVHCFNAALSDVETTQSLSFNAITSFAGTIVFEHKGWTSIPIKTTKLSNYIGDLTTIDLMKIDVEGAEIQVIDDLLQTGLLNIPSQYIIEYHYTEENPTQRESLLSKFEPCFDYQFDTAIKYFGKLICCVVLRCKKK